MLNHAYEGLVRYNDKLEIEPALATSWELASPTVWRFKLRQGVSFHDGAPFTADDVLASLERVSHPTSPLKGNLPAYKSAKKIDDHTVDIEVTDTYPLLLNDLTNIYIFERAVADQEQRHAADRCRQGRRGLRRPTMPTAPARSRSSRASPTPRPSSWSIRNGGTSRAIT